jgi:DNA polymerase-3 subunit delta'
VVLPEDQAIARGLATKGDFEGKASSSIRVATVRELNAWLAGRPVEGTTRVAIVLEAHRMGPEAQNALLKTLEEPRPGRTLVLVTSAPSALLATVRSRCQKLRFGTLDPAAVTIILEREMGRELVPSEVAATLARAEGSAARALELTRAGTLEPNRFEAALGALSPGSVLAVLDLAEEIGGDRQAAGLLLDALTALLARRTRGEANSNLGGALRSLSRRRATELLDHVGTLRRTVSSGANVTLAVEDLLLGLCSMGPAGVRTSARTAGT